MRNVGADKRLFARDPVKGSLWACEMRKILLLPALAILIATSSPAGPRTVLLTQITFIGYNDNYYICLSSERVLPPSHDRYTDYTYLYKYKNDGSVIEKTLLRQVSHIDDDYDGNWTHEDEVISSVNIQRYLKDHKMFIPFQKVCEDVLYLNFGEGGLFAENGDKKELLISAAAMGKYIKNYPYWHNQIRISKCYDTAPPYCLNKPECTKQDYFLVENVYFSEPPVYQALIAVNTADLDLKFKAVGLRE